MWVSNFIKTIILFRKCINDNDIDISLNVYFITTADDLLVTYYFLAGLSWSWSYGTCSWIYNYLCKSPLKVVSSNPAHGKVFSIQCDKVCKWLATGAGFLQVLLFLQPIKLTALKKLKYCWLIDLFIVVNATFSNISATCISWRPVLVVEEARVPGENHRPWASNW